MAQKTRGMFPVFFDADVEIGNSFDHKNAGLTIDFDYLPIHDWRELMEILKAL